jgi:hypothetical protein
MRYTTLLFLFSFSLSFSLTSCSSGDDGDEPTNPTPTEPKETMRVPLSVNVSETPLTDVAGSREDATRTDITTLPTLTHFKMNYYRSRDYEGDYEFEKNGTVWAATMSSEKYWPQEYTVGTIYPFCFYAYTAGTFNWEGGAYIHVNVDENAFKQEDVLVAKSVEYSKAKESAVNLSFDHICAAVGFTIRITDNLSKKLGSSTLYVTNIKLKAIAKSGDYYYDSGWSGISSDQTYYTLTYTDGKTVTTTQTEMKDDLGNTFYLFMIPQSCNASLEVKYKIGNGTEQTTTIDNISVNWQKGYRYFIDINLGTANIQVQ